MKILEYIIKSIENTDYLYRSWYDGVLSILPDNTTLNETQTRVENGKLFFGDEEVTEFTLGKPIIDYNRVINLPAGYLPMIKEDVKTTLGILLVNIYLNHYPYGDKGVYINGRSTPNTWNEYALAKLNKSLDVTAHIRFENVTGVLDGMAEMAVPSATRKSMEPSDAVIKYRDELFEKYKDQLNDPAILSDIQAELSRFLKEELKGDPSLGYLIKDKSFDVTRLQTYATFGAEPDFFDESKVSLVRPSLTEGWGVNEMPVLVNGSRSGSFWRGAGTAVGGYKTKVISRIFQNYHIRGEDCGTQLGRLVKINAVNAPMYVGRYVVGKANPLTLSELKAAIGKTLEIRSPGYCKQSQTDTCKRCVGDVVANAAGSVNSMAITMTSAIMSSAMAAMHTTALSTNKYSFRDRIV